MATYNLGKIVPSFSGAYDSSKVYNKLEIVYFNGSSWVATGTTSSEPSDDNPDWQKVAEGILYNFVGEWKRRTPYSLMDVVYYEGSSYVCKVDTVVDIIPTNEDYWQLLSEKGEKGEKGDKGDQGERGERGPQGIQGETGPQGIRGIQGEKGEKGDKGDKGDQGIPGPKGDTGPQGVQGERGADGVIGKDGAQGPKGDPFTYDDFTPEQLLSLKGPKGDPGERGPQGEQGPVGPQGEPGKDGTELSELAGFRVQYEDGTYEEFRVYIEKQ